MPKKQPIHSDLTFFGVTNFRGEEKSFGIKKLDRRQHMYVIGKTGVGKTALLKNMAFQDIQRGNGVAVIDPHGELVEELLEAVPEFRIKDVVYFNPADTDYPVGFNVLEVPDPKYKHLVASSLMSVFTKIWANVWSARMEYILHNSILALVDTPGTTLLGINRILVDRDYRQGIVDNLEDPVVKSFWVNEYAAWNERFRNEAIAPIQNKVGQFLNTALVRNIVGQPKSTINIPDIMDTGKILLINVSKGRIGEDNSALLGAMFITKMQLAAMERVRIPEEERKDFYLFVDEFQNFVTESFASILSEARKYHLNLTIAHQYIGQLMTEETAEVRDAVFGNVGTLLSFRVGAADAEFLEREFGPRFTAQDLVNLPNYNIYLRLMIDGITSEPFSATTLPPMEMGADKDLREKIIETSRRRYASDRETVEEEIAQWSGTMKAAQESAATAHELYEATCSVCGKETKVPFEPDPTRPVYCKDCLEKVKKGEIRPSKMKQGQKRKKLQKRKGFAELEKLGIERHALRIQDSKQEESSVTLSGKEVPKEVPEAKSLKELTKEGPTKKKELKEHKKETGKGGKKSRISIPKLKKSLEQAVAERIKEKEERGERAI